MLKMIVRGFQDLASSENDHSMTEFVGKTIRDLKSAHRLCLEPAIRQHVLREAPAKILDWNKFADQQDGPDQDSVALQDFVVSKIASMHIPNGGLFIEIGDYDAGIGFLITEAADGISFLEFLVDDGIIFGVLSATHFSKDGDLSSSLTAVGVREVRNTDPREGTNRADKILKNGRTSFIPEANMIFAAAWLHSEKDKVILQHMTKPLNPKSTSAAEIHPKLKSLHPHRFLTDFPGIIDAKVTSGNRHGDMDAMNRVMQTMMSTYPAWCAGLAIESRPPNPMTTIRGIMELNANHSQFERLGSQCFLLNGKLSSVIAQTDLTGLMVEDIRTPYDMIFLGFEENIPFVAGDEDLIFEGAYISTDVSGTMNITMIVCPSEPKGHVIQDFRNPISISLDLRAGMSLSDALLQALDNGGYDIDEGVRMTLSDIDIETAADMGFCLSVPKVSSQEFIAKYNSSAFNSVADCLKIIGNSLVMISAKPDQVIEKQQWPGASAEALHRLNASSKKGRERGERLAIKEGVLGYRFLTLDPSVAASMEEKEVQLRGSPAVSFWRKGFWRQQAYGAGRELRKQVWIEPVLCNEKAGLISRGSVYENKVKDEDDDIMQDVDSSPGF